MSGRKELGQISRTEFEEALQEDFENVMKHGIMVGRMVTLVGRSLNEEEDFIREMVIASLLHDIGKLRLSKYLYGRIEGALDEEEIKYMRRHTKYSYEVVKQEGFSESIQEMVYHHHENYDGTGYPDNLAGEAIPWGARILRICDMFCALLSDRSYRSAFDVDTAMEMMIDEIKNFDMRAFLAFQRVVNSEDFEEIQRIVDYVNSTRNATQLWELYLKDIEEEMV